MRPSRTRHPDDGHAAIELALAVAVLLLPAALAMLSFGPWAERSVVAESAAAEGARAAVLSLSTAAGSESVAQMAANFGIPADQVRHGWCGSSAAQGGTGECSFERGEGVTLTVEVWVPLIPTPWGDIGGLWIGADHAEPLDLYRSLG
jgi:hypothetical protein